MVKTKRKNVVNVVKQRLRLHSYLVWFTWLKERSWSGLKYVPNSILVYDIMVSPDLPVSIDFHAVSSTRNCFWTYPDSQCKIEEKN